MFASCRSIWVLIGHTAIPMPYRKSIEIYGKLLRPLETFELIVEIRDRYNILYTLLETNSSHLKAWMVGILSRFLLGR